MSWLKRSTSPEMKEVDAQAKKLDQARTERQSALKRLMKAIENAPLDDVLVGLSNDLGNSKKNGY